MCESEGRRAAVAPKESCMNELQNIFIGQAAAAPPAHILEALTDAQVHARPAGAPLSIYDEVWHVAFWAEMTLDWIGGKATPYPASASEGFPTESHKQGEDWPALRARLMRGLEALAAAAGDLARLDLIVDCPSQPGFAARPMTVREQLENTGAHNAYHLGKIVLLRQLLQCWPPPSGGDTW